MLNVTLRQAVLEDSDEVARIARTSREHFLPYLPKLHSVEGDRKFYRNRVFGSCEVWVAEDNQEFVSFFAFRAGWIDNLYALPGHVGKGLGAALLNTAKARHPLLQLWAFQRNMHAIRSYERNGFLRIRETGGSSSEEKRPGAPYEWKRSD